MEIRPSSVRVTIISEPNAQISFKFWLLLPLGHTLARDFGFLEIKIGGGGGFSRLFFFFVNKGSYGSKIFKQLLLPQITIEYFETSPQFSSQ